MITPPDHPPRIAIQYCTQCQWLLRAAWMAQELLSTFGADLGEVPSRSGPSARPYRRPSQALGVNCQ
ncbi:Uncharacterized protein conserved in bacteria [Bordetella pertussis]|nr:Uncharacterized protein conserved in bacteria [Bordetella pertussis]